MPRVSIAPEAGLTTEINVLPLIDVLLVLIIVFFLAAKILTWIPAQVPPPADAGTRPDGGQIVLELRADGSIAVNSQPIPMGQLEIQLRATFQDRPRRLLFMDVAPDRVYQDAITAMDIAREAGVETIAWVPRRARAGVQ
jgi:biopolymer transport protein ExbD